jgi:sulfide:quinone oxidoreductase
MPVPVSRDMRCPGRPVGQSGRDHRLCVERLGQADTEVVTKRIVVLGGGTGGTLLANRLRRHLDRAAAEIVVVDADDEHVYQPGLLFVPFGLARPEALVRSRRQQLRSGVEFHCSAVEHVDLENDTVLLADRTLLAYDVLVVATGARLMPEETEGLLGAGWLERVFSFYSLDAAVPLQKQLARFDGGRLVVGVMDMPIKCPVAPLEFCFLADWYFQQRGIRDRVDLAFVTPLDGAFTKAACNRELSGLLDDKRISLVTEFNTGEVDGRDGRLVSYDGREVPFDLAVVVPLHGGQAYVDRSPGLGDELGFVPTDQHTLQAKVKPNVFVIGDAADVPASKAGSVAHFEGHTLAGNICRYLAGEPLEAGFDGHTNCFIESGFSKALLIDFNYDTEPVTGRFPGRIGLPLLRESRLNHAGKLAFAWLYWHMLLPGRDMPAVPSRMPTAGKHIAGTAHQSPEPN